jgi:hypothetical protein
MRTMGRTAILGLLGWVVLTAAAPACPFCSMSGETLLSLADQSNMILYGTLRPGMSDNNPNDIAAGTSVLTIEKVVKPNANFKDGKLTINRYIPTEAEGKVKFLVFCDIYKGKIDPFRGMAVRADSDMPKYLEGALAVQKEPLAKRLRFFFDYLDNADTEIALDAYKEFGNADYKDYSPIAATLPAEKVSGWLKSDKTASFRLGLYASMLGHCGQSEPEKYYQQLRGLLEAQDKMALSGVDGILAGMILLQPKEGWAYLTAILKDGKKAFATRYAALRTARFFWENRSDVVPKKDVVEAVSLMLHQSDAADLAVEDLRKWQAWEKAGEVLDLKKTDAYDLPIVRRAVLRYALVAAPHVPAAKEYVDALRKSDPAAVADAEEILRLERPPTPVTPKDK